MDILTLGSKYQNTLTPLDAEQFSRIEMARGCWREGQPDNALVILDTLIGENLSPSVLAECRVTQAAFRAEKGLWQQSLDSLLAAAPHLDHLSPRLRGMFFNQRARAYKETGRLDLALLDYTGAAVWFEEAGDLEYQGAVAINLAGLSLKLGDLERAQSSIEHAIKIYTDLGSEYVAQAYDTFANILIERTQYPEALLQIEKAISFGVENQAWTATFLTTRGIIKARTGDHSAREDVDRAIEISAFCDCPLGVIEACRSAIKNLDLPIEDLIAYYQRADAYETANLRDCARIIMDRLPRGTIEEMQVDMIRRALIKSKGSISRAADIVGLTHKGVDCVINRHPDKLGNYRSARIPRKKSLIPREKTLVKK